MNETLTGGCQCGRLRYEIHAEPINLYVCHCIECQKQSSSAFGMSLVVPREAFTLVRGEPKVWRRRADSGREVICNFCGDCGSRLFHQPARNPDIVNVKPGTLDDTQRLSPTAHLWTRSAQPWVAIPDHLPSYAAEPDDAADPFKT